MSLAALRAIRRFASFTIGRMAERGDGWRMGHWAFLALESGYLTEWGKDCEAFSDYQDLVKHGGGP